MIVVVEGPDGSGKSTLIDNLRLSCDRHCVTLGRSGRPKDLDEIKCVVSWIEKYSGPTPLLMDRHPFISEAIYGNVLRGKSLLQDYYTMHDIDMHFRTSIDLVIYCRPPTSVIYHKLNANPQLKGVREHINEIVRMYDSTMRYIEHAGARVVEYDWTNNEKSVSPEQLIFGASNG